MAMSLTLGALVRVCQQRADRDGDSQLDTTEYKDLISEKYAEMHALVSEKDPTFFATESTLALGSLLTFARTRSNATVGASTAARSASRRRSSHTEWAFACRTRSRLTCRFVTASPPSGPTRRP